MAGWLEGLNAPDLGLVVAGKHFAATQSMDEEKRQNINFGGAFGHKGAIVRSVRKADESTISFSAILLKPGQDVGMDALDDEDYLEDQDAFKVLCRRGANNWKVYPECSWSMIHIASTLDQVMLNADISHPQQ